MKNLPLNILFLLLSVLVLSCSKENEGDEESTPKASAIVGEWKSTKDVEVCSTGSSEVTLLEDCGDIGVLIFLTDGTLRTYEYEEVNAACVQQETYTIGTYILEDDTLSFDITGLGVTEFTFFELEGNVLKLGQYDNDPEFSCDGGNDLSHYYVEMEKQ